MTAPRDTITFENAAPRDLLGLLIFMARTDATIKAKLNDRPAGRPRRTGRAGAIRARKRRRLRARDRVLQRNTWRSYHEEEKRRARAEA